MLSKWWNISRLKNRTWTWVSVCPSATVDWNDPTGHKEADFWNSLRHSWIMLHKLFALIWWIFNVFFGGCGKMALLTSIVRDGRWNHGYKLTVFIGPTYFKGISFDMQGVDNDCIFILRCTVLLDSFLQRRQKRLIKLKPYRHHSVPDTAWSRELIQHLLILTFLSPRTTIGTFRWNHHTLE